MHKVLTKNDVLRPITFVTLNLIQQECIITDNFLKMTNALHDYFLPQISNPIITTRYACKGHGVNNMKYVPNNIVFCPSANIQGRWTDKTWSSSWTSLAGFVKAWVAGQFANK